MMFRSLRVLAHGLLLGTIALLTSQALRRTDLPMVGRVVAVGGYGAAVMILSDWLREEIAQPDDNR